MTDAGATAPPVEGGLDEPAELEPEQGSLALASPEDTHGRAEWEEAAAAVLRKARRLTDEDEDAQVWQKLTRPTLDGIGVTPLGTRDLLDDLQTSGRPTRGGAWDIRAHLGVVDAKAAHEEAMTDLENGVTSLWLRLEPDADLDTLLEGVFLDLAPVVLDAPTDPMAAAMALLTRAEDIELHPATNLGIPAEKVTAAAAGLAYGNGVLGFVVDATTVHDRGASDVQELAHSMHVAATYLRSLTGDGIMLEDAAALVEFRYAATDEQFPTIAKLRAARRLWARVLELSGAPAGSTTPDAPARSHEPADDERLRPVGQHAAHHRGGVRGGRRGRRRGHRAAVRQPARPSGRLRPPDRPQHQLAAHLRVPSRPGRRPGRWLVRRGEAHRRPRRRRVGAVRAAGRAARTWRRWSRRPRPSATSRSPPGAGR